MRYTPKESEDRPNVLQRTADFNQPNSWQTWLIGRPLQTADAPHQTISKKIGLAVFASDALSSTAYATQEILFILAAAGSAAFGNVFYISIAIVILLTIVTVSYEQTIHAYPSGGGAYIVARDNIGEYAALVAGAALLTDYILTVAVSISSGVAQLASAYPALLPYRPHVATLLILFVAVVNLRGVKESGAAFALPTYFFIIMMFTTVGLGFIRLINGTLGSVVDPPHLEIEHALVAVTPFLLLHAFSSGTAALTGVEAISNGITAFKEPRSRNAGITLIWMAMILGSLFLGISFLTGQIHAVPSELETVISQLTRTVFGNRGVFYLATIGATAVILILAANTAYADFPRLSALIANDGFLPRSFNFRGSRLVYSNGIIALSVIAIFLIWIFNASVTRLIPLYAIGVFLSFTLSQAGMARRWRKIGKLKPGEVSHEPGSVLKYEKNWNMKMIVNGFGAACTAIVMMVFAITKFNDGAWIVLLLTPALVIMFISIHRHYKDLATHLTLDDFGAPPNISRHRVIIPISGVHRGSLAALRYASVLSDDITAVFININPEETQKIQEKWDHWGNGVRLIILDSPYRQLLEPLLDYIEEVAAHAQPNETLTIVVPQFIPKSRLHSLLHSNTAFFLRLALLNKPNIVITDVPYRAY